jgi:cardiolipin synthase
MIGQQNIRLQWICVLLAGSMLACAPALSQIEVPNQGAGIISETHSTDQSGLELAQLMKAELEITGRPLIGGNRVKLLRDGPETFKAMFAAMGKARHHIHLETFIIDDEEIGQRLADILIERRGAGVEVRMVYDAFGALNAESRYFTRLRQNGVALHKFHPINPLEDVRIGRLAFIGGLNISDTYSASSLSGNTGLKEGWRDTQVQVEGPGVRQLQELFVHFWSDLEGDALKGPNYFPELAEQGSDLVRAVHSDAGDAEVNIYRLYLAAIANAQKRIWITQGYFSPDERFIKALAAASERGVDVRLLLPGLTDSWITINSSRKNYTQLLNKGIRVFERTNVLQHAKTAVVDGVWSTVGSANLDYRSFLHANEANLIIWGQDFASEMEALFLDDQERSMEIVLSSWRERPWRKKVLERVASWFVYWL